MNRPLQRIFLFSGLLLIVLVLVGLVFYSSTAIQFASGTLETKTIPQTTIKVDIEQYSDAQINSILDSIVAQNSTVLITNISRVTSIVCEKPEFETLNGYPQKISTLLTLSNSRSLKNFIGLVSNISTECLATSNTYNEKLSTQTASVIEQAVTQGYIYSSSFSGFVIPYHPNLYSTESKQLNAINSYYSRVINFSEIQTNSISVFAFIDLSQFRDSIPQEDQVERLKEFRNITGLKGFIFRKDGMTTQSFQELLKKEFTTSLFLVE